LRQELIQLRAQMDSKDDEEQQSKKYNKLIKDKDKMIMKLKKDMEKQKNEMQFNIKTLKQEVERKDLINSNLRSDITKQKLNVRKLRSDIKSYASVSHGISLSSDGPVLETEKRVKLLKISSGQKSPKKANTPKRITDTGSFYPNELTVKVESFTKNDSLSASKQDSVNNSRKKEELQKEFTYAHNLTLPPPAKSLEELKGAMLQFRSVLRISNVGVEEFLDTVVFRNKETTIKFVDFKVSIEAILKNYTHDFACY